MSNKCRKNVGWHVSRVSAEFREAYRKAHGVQLVCTAHLSYPYNTADSRVTVTIAIFSLSLFVLLYIHELFIEYNFTIYGDVETRRRIAVE